MSKYISYKLDDNTEILIESDEHSIGPIQAGSDIDPVVKAERTFSESLDSVKSAAQTMRNKFAVLDADETEVSFDLKTTGELGVFAIAKIGLDACLKVTLKWKRSAE